MGMSGGDSGLAAEAAKVIGDTRFILGVCALAVVVGIISSPDMELRTSWFLRVLFTVLVMVPDNPSAV